VSCGTGLSAGQTLIGFGGRLGCCETREIEQMNRIVAASDLLVGMATTVLCGCGQDKDAPVFQYLRGHDGLSVGEADAMAGAVESKLNALGITLKEPAKPIANYVPYVRTGNLLDFKDQALSRLGPSVVGATAGLCQQIDAARAHR